MTGMDEEKVAATICHDSLRGPDYILYLIIDREATDRRALCCHLKMTANLKSARPLNKCIVGPTTALQRLVSAP